MGVFDGQGAVADQFVEIGVVDGELHALAGLDHIGATVADIAKDEFVAIECRCDHGGAHAFVLWALPLLPDGAICRSDRLEQPGAGGGAGVGGGGEGLKQGGHGAGAGDLSTCHAAHAVADDVKTLCLAVTEGVLVVSADAADVTERRDFDAHRSRRTGRKRFEGRFSRSKCIRGNYLKWRVRGCWDCIGTRGSKLRLPRKVEALKAGDGDERRRLVGEVHGRDEIRVQVGVEMASLRLVRLIQHPWRIGCRIRVECAPD